jgi:hypothetical protein
MIAYILYEVLNLEANLYLFLFFSILPDATWFFYKNHRKESWYHTVLAFSWIIIFHPYWISILSHFVVDFFFGGIRLTPWSKKRIGLIHKERRIPKTVPLVERLFKHLKWNVYNKKYLIVIELALLIVSLVLFFT